MSQPARVISGSGRSGCIDQTLSIEVDDLGLALYFERDSQSLSRIRVYTNSDLLRITHDSEILKDLHDVPKLHRVINLFPPTTLGVFQDVDNSYTIEYASGIRMKFIFRSVDQYVRQKGRKEHPVGDHNDSPLLEFLDIFTKDRQPPYSDFSDGRVEILTSYGLSFNSTDGDNSRFLGFGSGRQEVMAILGAPDFVVFDRYVYLRYGVDLIFSDEDYGTLSNAVLHSNEPFHTSFGNYRKAPFTLSDPNKLSKAKSGKTIITEIDLLSFKDHFGDPGEPLVLTDASISMVRQVYCFSNGLSCDTTSDGSIEAIEVSL